MATFDFPILYDDGTVTVTQNSDLVTGDLTVWVSALLPGDDFICNGLISVVKEIISDTQIRLVMPWTGTTAADVPYVARRWLQHTDPRWFGVRVSQLLTEVGVVPTQALQYREEARMFAEHPEDDDVTGFPGEYSAFHWSCKAQAHSNVSQQWSTSLVVVADGKYGALKYANDAAAQAVLAQKWASETTDIPVSGTAWYSARHYSVKAQLFAQDAADSTTAAAAYNSQALGHATNAETYKNQALAYRDTTSGYRNDAAAFRNDAETFKNQAAASATAAATSASNAAAAAQAVVQDVSMVNALIFG